MKLGKSLLDADVKCKQNGLRQLLSCCFIHRTAAALMRSHIGEPKGPYKCVLAGFSPLAANIYIVNIF